jgi:alcohol dehydrogenase class IV
MNFDFSTSPRILFGAGALPEAAKAAAGWGNRLALVTGHNATRAAPLREQLAAKGLAVLPLTVHGEPTTDWVSETVAQARAFGPEVVIGFGGGSALDAGKALAALLTNPGAALDYLEVIGRGQPLANAPLPYIAIPTTAGTGSEVTRNAVLASPEHRVKASLRNPLMLPRLAVVDPTLTYDLPPALTASTGLDALTQLIEPYTCNAPNPLVDAVCREGIGRAARSVRIAYENGHNEAARADMALASLFSGLALANAKLGAVHGFAGPLGGLYPAPHGVICARLLPIVTEANIRALQKRRPDSPALARYADVMRWLTGEAHATLADGVRWLYDLRDALHIPPLAQYGFTAEAIPTVIPQAQTASSMKGNAIGLTDDELAEALRAA